MNSQAKQLDALTGIRAFAAAWVVFHHYNKVIQSLLPGTILFAPLGRNGWLGVELFFTLSGFIISYNYLDKLGSPKIRQIGSFFQARFARIFPAYLAALCCLVPFVLYLHAHNKVSGRVQYTLEGFIKSLLMVQGWGDWSYATWNTVGWSVSAEWFAYLAFPLLALVLVRIRHIVPVVLLIPAVLLVSIKLQVQGGFVGFGGHGPIALERMAGCFTAGALTFVLYRSGWLKQLPWHVINPILLVAIVVGPWFLDSHNWPPQLVALMMPAVILGLAYRDLKILSSRFAVFWGKASYSLYLTHFSLQVLLFTLFSPARFHTAPFPVRLLVLAFYFSAIAAVAAGMYLFIEEPGRRLLRKKRNRELRLTMVGSGSHFMPKRTESL